MRDTEPVTTAVVVAFNSAEALGDNLRTLLAYGETLQIVLVDNASTDQSAAIFRDLVPGGKCVVLDSNVGFGGACNAGAEAAETEFVLFINPDAALVSFAAPPPAPALEWGIAAAQLNGPDRDGLLSFETHWRAECLTMMFNLFGKPRHVAPKSWGKASSNAWVSGAAIVVKRDEFMSIGGFDESFFMYYEDRELCRRYRERGLPIRTTERVVVEHEPNGSSDVTTDLRIAWALAGLVEYTERSSGRGGRCARLVVWMLRAAEAARVAPSARARGKAHQASLVRRRLLDWDIGVAHNRYPTARRCFSGSAKP